MTARSRHVPECEYVRPPGEASDDAGSTLGARGVKVRQRARSTSVQFEASHHKRTQLQTRKSAQVNGTLTANRCIYTAMEHCVQTN